MALRVGLGLGQLEAVTILLLLGLLQSGIRADGTEASCGAVIQPRITYDGNHVCGGSLVSNKWVVSAAHCFPREHSREAYEVKLGAHQLDSYSNDTVVHTVAQIITHSSYREEGSQGDIALIRLSSPVTFSRYISLELSPRLRSPSRMATSATIILSSAQRQPRNC